MNYQYKVVPFVPKLAGCAARDNGWDAVRCQQFQAFLDQHAAGGWKLQSSEYQRVVGKGCLGVRVWGMWLVCVFEKPV